jgi:hypothetical protein
MKKSYKSNIILVFLILILTLYLVNSKLTTTAILEYTNLYITKLFPSSFTIFIITNLILNYNPVKHISKITKKPANLYILLISIISGFPGGPKNISLLYKQNHLTKTTANYLLKSTHYPNPLFVLGPISILLNSKKTAIKILFSLIISNLIIYIKNYKNYEQSFLPEIKQKTFSESLSFAIIESAKLQVLIYGTNIFFYLISITLTSTIQTSPIFYVLINGFFDLTKGIFSVSILNSTLLKSLLVLSFISFGSVSLHIQIKSILMDAKLSYKSFIQGRLITTILSIIIFLILNSF